MSVKLQYRISTGRFDVPRSTYSTPEFEGETIEECDQKALEHFRSLTTKPSNAWEEMAIVRIDSPAIAERITFLGNNEG